MAAALAQEPRNNVCCMLRVRTHTAQAWCCTQRNHAHISTKQLQAATRSPDQHRQLHTAAANQAHLTNNSCCMQPQTTYNGGCCSHNKTLPAAVPHHITPYTAANCTLRRASASPYTNDGLAALYVSKPPAVYLLGAGSALRPRVLSVLVLRVRARLAGRGLLGTPLNMLAVGFTSSLLCTQPPRPSKPPEAAAARTSMGWR
jgi:hypothetical protein